MTNITFDDNLITGNDTIDTQHEETDQPHSTVRAACESGDGKVKAIKMLDYLDEIHQLPFPGRRRIAEKSILPRACKASGKA